jgi:hypothetical protein
VKKGVAAGWKLYEPEAFFRIVLLICGADGVPAAHRR